MHYKERSYPCNWLGADDVDALMHFFYAASFHVSKLLARNPRIIEDSLTDLLIDKLSDESVKLGSAEYPGLGLNKTVFRFIPRPNEPKTGADIGIVLNTRNYDLDVTKAILVQCKKLHFGDPHMAMTNYTCFGEPECLTTLFGKRSFEQARKLLALSPASFFLLFNPPLEPWRRLGVLEVESRTRELEWFANVAIDIELDALRTEFDEALSRFFGPTVLPATTVMGCFKNKDSMARRESSSASGIKRAVRYGSRFYDFMVNDFLQGKIGDSREEVIDAATGGQPDVFSPRYTLYFEVIDHA